MNKTVVVHRSKKKVSIKYSDLEVCKKVIFASLLFRKLNINIPEVICYELKKREITYRLIESSVLKSSSKGFQKKITWAGCVAKRILSADLSIGQGLPVFRVEFLIQKLLNSFRHLNKYLFQDGLNAKVYFKSFCLISEYLNGISKAICHGDFGLHNMILSKNDQNCYLIDLDEVAIGPWCYDLASLILSSYEVGCFQISFGEHLLCEALDICKTYCYFCKIGFFSRAIEEKQLKTKKKYEILLKKYLAKNFLKHICFPTNELRNFIDLIIERVRFQKVFF